MPRAPAGRSVYIAPLGDFPIDTADALTGYYRDRYALRITLLPSTSIDHAVRDSQRHQLIGEDLIGMIELRVEGKRAELGYVLSRAAWGQGYMTPRRTGRHLRDLSLEPIVLPPRQNYGFSYTWSSHPIFITI